MCSETPRASHSGFWTNDTVLTAEAEDTKGRRVPSPSCPCDASGCAGLGQVLLCWPHAVSGRERWDACLSGKAAHSCC